MFKIFLVWLALVMVMICLESPTARCDAWLYSPAINADFNGDNTVNVLDLTILTNSYGDYDYWHFCDFNLDTCVNNEDLNIFETYMGKNRPTLQFLVGEGWYGYEFVRTNRDWLLEMYDWNTIKNHPWQDTPPYRYVCTHFAHDYKNSIKNSVNDIPGGQTLIYECELTKHVITVHYLGGNPKIDSNWHIYTSNGVLWDLNLDYFRTRESVRKVYITGGYTEGGVYITWELNSNYGTMVT